MANSMIGAQLYTVREFTKTPADIIETMKKVRAIGYEAVQLSALAPMDTKELANVCRGEGITVAATHIGYERIRDETDAVIEEHQTLGCPYVGIGGMAKEYREAKRYSEFAKDASVVCRKLKDAGLTFVYHNHSWELEKHEGRVILDILYEDSDPDVFTSEIDTYWIQHGGGDPALWIRKVAGRADCVHFKDMAVIDGKPTYAEVGEGNLNWPAILDACKAAGAKWYLVEQDQCQGDPFDSLATSFNNLRAMGVH